MANRPLSHFARRQIERDLAAGAVADVSETQELAVLLQLRMVLAWMLFPADKAGISLAE